MLSECSRPYRCLHEPTANILPRLQITSLQCSEPWNAQSLLSSKDQHTSGLNINKVLGNTQLTEQSGSWKLRESLPGDEPRGWNTHAKDRKRHGVLKDGSSGHAVHQQGVKRNTETTHGLGCSLHLHREAVCAPEEVKLLSRPPRPPELRTAAGAPVQPPLCCAHTLPTHTTLLQQLDFDMKTDISLPQ